MIKSALVFLVINLLIVNGYALDLELTSGLIKKIPVAFIDFNGDADLTSKNTINNTIFQDLNFSNQFTWINDDKINEDEEINFKKWQEKGANYIINGKIEALRGNRFYISLTLSTPLSNNHTLLQKDFSIEANDLENLSHHISDILFQYLTGEKGIFTTKLAYVSIDTKSRPWRYTLRVADYNGKNAAILLSSTQPIMSPSWSPTAKQLAYVSFENHKSEIYIIDIATGNRQLLTSFNGINGAPAWSPDGKRLAIVLSKDGNPNLYLINHDGSGLTRLTQGAYIDTEPYFSKDGNSIYFTSNRGGGPQIYKINLIDKNIARVTFNGKYNAHARITDDEKNLVVMHKRGKKFSIAKQNLKSGELIPMTFKGQNESPSISPNGAFVVYANKTQEGKQSLKIIALESFKEHTLDTPGDLIQEPAWSPQFTG